MPRPAQQLCQRPELFAELLKEQQQESQQNQKRAASATPGSKPSKQQKLNGILSGGRKARVDAKVAAFFYAEGIDFDKV